MSSIERFEPGARVGVLTAEPLDRVLTYRAPEGGCVQGDFVEVPLGPRKVLGVVWSAGEQGFDAAKLRAINRVLDVAPMRSEMASFLSRVGDYTLTPLSQMLRLATRAPGLSDPPSMRKVLRASGHLPNRLTDARAKVMEVLRHHPTSGFTQKELADLAQVSGSVVKGLVKMGAINEEDTPKDLPYPTLDPNHPGKELTADQKAAADQLCEGVRSGLYNTSLLRGVTGAGKTEVYLEAVAACLAKGRQALVLLPEIALSAEFIDRVQERFAAQPAQWHSGVTMTERRRCFRMVGEGAASLVVGARSALFLPFRDLGLIIVDEEHDTSYKQEEGVFYSARDMSVLRGSICDATVVLASATPSLETWANCESGKYKRIELTSRYGPAVMPEMRAIDMRDEKLAPQTWISPSLKAAVNLRISRAEQSLLFINRRGYAPVTVCRACGHQIGCDHCDANMVEHRFQNRLMCHQCGDTKPMPEACPDCEVEGKLAAVGPGVERLAQEVSDTFPEARVAVLSSDLFASTRALKAQIKQIADGEADIIIGTQLVAKGHNFPKLTLVGVIDADLGLQGSDLRAAERTFQLIRQVAGRAGRAEKPGVAMLQSYQPEHPVIRAILAGEEEQFWKAQALERHAASVPPYGRMAGIILSSTDMQSAMALGQDMAKRSAPLTHIGAQIFGPAPAPIARVRGRFRVRLLVKADKNTPLQAAIKTWVKQFSIRGDMRIAIDIDPQSFY